MADPIRAMFDSLKLKRSQLGADGKVIRKPGDWWAIAYNVQNGVKQDGYVYWTGFGENDGITISYYNGGFYISCGNLWVKSRPMCPTHFTWVPHRNIMHMTVMGQGNLLCQATRPECRNQKCWVASFEVINGVLTPKPSVPAWLKAQRDYVNTLNAANTFWALYKRAYPPSRGGVRKTRRTSRKKSPSRRRTRKRTSGSLRHCKQKSDFRKP